MNITGRGLLGILGHQPWRGVWLLQQQLGALITSRVTGCSTSPLLPQLVHQAHSAAQPDASKPRDASKQREDKSRWIKAVLIQVREESACRPLGPKQGHHQRGLRGCWIFNDFLSPLVPMGVHSLARALAQARGRHGNAVHPTHAMHLHCHAGPPPHPRFRV